MLTGAMFIAGDRVAGADGAGRSFEATTGEPLDPEYGYASAADVDAACRAAEAAFDGYRNAPLETRARLLSLIALGIEGLGDELVDRVRLETGLSEKRVRSEIVRTTGQLRLFAGVVRAGGWLGVRVDPARSAADAQASAIAPARGRDIRQQRVPVGPVAVFGASNFPLAFSAAGVDTASALAAGCPVVVKGHEAHLGTSELIGGVIADVVSALGLPAGVFSMLFGEGPSVGQALVAHPAIRAVGFTGSQRAGTALMATAAARPVPIPVYAEMSSVNPVFLFPGALDARAEALAESFAVSLTGSAGQLCTNPGLLLAVRGEGLDRFLARARELVEAAPAQTMLTPGIAAAYRRGVERIAAQPGVELAAAGDASGAGANDDVARLFVVDESDFAGNEELVEEAFGATATLVRVDSSAEFVSIARELPGQLTSTVHADADDPADAAGVRELLPALERLAGRILFDGWPTGVEVGHAIVHGGPFPATSDSRTTSVGSLAIDRFLRPVAYQDVPEAFLPEALKDANPLGVPRLVNGAPEARPVPVPAAASGSGSAVGGAAARARSAEVGAGSSSSSASGADSAADEAGSSSSSADGEIEAAAKAAIEAEKAAKAEKAARKAEQKAAKKAAKAARAAEAAEAAKREAEARAARPSRVSAAGLAGLSALAGPAALIGGGASSALGDAQPAPASKPSADEPESDEPAADDAEITGAVAGPGDGEAENGEVPSVDPDEAEKGNTAD